MVFGRTSSGKRNTSSSNSLDSSDEEDKEDYYPDEPVSDEDPDDDDDEFRDEERDVQVRCDSDQESKDDDLKESGDEGKSESDEDESDHDQESDFEDEDNDVKALDEEKLPETYPGPNNDTIVSNSDNSNTMQRMTVVFLFVLGIVIGFFVVFAIGSQRRNNNNDKNAVPTTALPTTSPVLSDTGDVFNNDQTLLPVGTSSPTVVPTVSFSSMAPTRDNKIDPATLAPTTEDSFMFPIDQPIDANLTDITVTLVGIEQALDESAQTSFAQVTQDFVQGLYTMVDPGRRGLAAVDGVILEALVVTITRVEPSSTGDIIVTLAIFVTYVSTLESVAPETVIQNPFLDAAVVNEFVEELKQVVGSVLDDLQTVAFDFVKDENESNTTTVPTSSRTLAPTKAPSNTTETKSPSPAGTKTPSLNPTTNSPTEAPTEVPTESKATPLPSQSPTDKNDNPAPPPSGNTDIVYGLQPDCQVQDETRFNICLDLSSESGQVEDWFPLMVSAAKRWERIIAQDPWGPWPSGYFNSLNANYVATEKPTFEVDDLYMAVIVRPIDGTGKRFAEAGPDRFLAEGTIAVSIVIDSADIQNVIDQGIFEDLMLHEIGHCMGLGPMWKEDVQIKGADYIGPNAVQAWRDLGCSGPLPLNSASDNAHFNDKCLETELMTHYLRYGQPLHISSISMGALEDLGFVVNWDEQDEYTLANLGDCGTACPEAGSVRRALRGPVANEPPQLSHTAQVELLEAAADRFRERRALTSDRQGAIGDQYSGVQDGRVVSYLYQENGHFISHTIHQKQVESRM